ncbi:unnamed protein product [Rhizoctonia solani]|uniref:RRM domain-containing protein n=2 Tax=Rhizoctonia solani TaxID=456999 RepID=A0A8H3H5H0_9AGAM|nr:uncharacterized protein RhiXN_06644 [Rhizoctonia solani]QRW21655.1 hypothetical protein RhiXN_06644 [Rhizoctonia solani]CAE6483715.1 unnamed protein product [Rhizoctonia solani]
MASFDRILESRGWPFSDCAIHVQFRGEDNSHFSLDDIRQSCGGFGRILKIYVWTAKRSQKPQACVLFDAVEAVKAADRSTHNGSCRLWKNGYHMLRMCESTTMILASCLKKDGLTHGHPMFAGIPLRRVSYQVQPPTRGVKSPEKAHRPIPTGPRYQPYSLDSRPPAPPSPPRASSPDALFISFPPKREAPPAANPVSPSQRNRAQFSPPQPNTSNGLLLPRKEATPPPPIKPRQQTPTQAIQIERPEQTQIDKNKKLETDIRDLVSTHIDSISKVQEAEIENQRLRARLRNSEEELALLADTVKRVEGREQAAIALLTETETRSQEQLQLLRNSLEVVESAKTKAEIDLETLKQKYGILEAQLLSTQEQLRLFSLSRRSIDQSMRALSDSPRPGLEAAKASSIERDDVFITPTSATDYTRNPILGKGTLQNMAGLLDAFKEIDDLVKSAFRG